MTYDTKCTKCDAETEIIKSMHDPMPRCQYCGGELKRIYSLPAAVHYHANGFTTNDKRFSSQIPPERFAKFERERADIERRAQRGQLTQYERMLERPALNETAA